jgi:UDPglucose--hexose-1-phosphate uridylyltransferase
LNCFLCLGRVEDDKDDDDKDTNDNQQSTNPLCPGAIRGKNNQRNPFYEHTYVFDNDFPALLSDIPDQQHHNDDLFQCHAARGVCKVICFHPNSKLTLPRMTLDDISYVIKTWMDVFKDLANKYRWVQIFENRGDIMGCSSNI